MKKLSSGICRIPSYLRIEEFKHDEFQTVLVKTFLSDWQFLFCSLSSQQCPTKSLSGTFANESNSETVTVQRSLNAAFRLALGIFSRNIEAGVTNTVVALHTLQQIGCEDSNRLPFDLSLMSLLGKWIPGYRLPWEVLS